MIVWLNGAWDTGLRRVAHELVEMTPGSILYDPELTGGQLRALLPQKRLDEVGDERELPSWRRLVVETAAALLAEADGPLVVPAALWREEHRDEIFGRLASRGFEVRHLLVSFDETILHTGSFPHWLAGDAHLVDTAGQSAREAAEEIASCLGAGAGYCDIVQNSEPTGETLAAGVLLFDEDDRVLLVDPTYKPGWEFPGGVVEPGEAPARGGVREVAEELGLSLRRAPRLLVVDWEPPRPPEYGGLRLLYDGGRLGPAEAAGVLLPGPELRAWRFVTEDEAGGLLPSVRFSRLRWALRARRQGAAVYLEGGAPVADGA
ncbi:NUDIX domain-containing protein [Streptomyces sp. NPDC004134]|uniref:NUDIX domain-containing protein n=1 Tax=Streptomyces sp. NPDC004134 TaxID=3364691 RepID=UPI0036B654AB